MFRNYWLRFPDVEPEKNLLRNPIVSDSEWIEPLSERELEVLQLIADGLSRQEIASQLGSLLEHSQNTCAQYLQQTGGE